MIKYFIKENPDKGELSKCSCIGSFRIVKMANFPNRHQNHYQTFIKISAGFFVDIYKLIRTCIWEWK